MTKQSESLRQMALSDRKLSWLGSFADEMERLENENVRMGVELARRDRDLEAFRGAGLRYEEEIAKLKEAARGSMVIVETVRGEVERLSLELEKAKSEFHKAQCRVYDVEGICEHIAHGDSPCDYCTLECTKGRREHDSCCTCFIAAFSEPLNAENGGTDAIT